MYSPHIQLISLNSMFFKLIQIDTCIGSSFRFATMQPSIAMNTRFITHFIVDGHPGYYQFWVIKNNAALHIPVYVFCLYLRAFICVIYLEVKLLSYRYF